MGGTQGEPIELAMRTRPQAPAVVATGLIYGFQQCDDPKILFVSSHFNHGNTGVSDRGHVSSKQPTWDVAGELSMGI